MFGTPVRFALPADLLGKTASYVLRYLGVEPVSAKAATQQLEELINARATELPLPDGCVVIPAALEHPVIWPDALSTLAILAKCSDSIWLRSKQPALNAALKRRQVTLLVPPLFAHRLTALWIRTLHGRFVMQNNATNTSGKVRLYLAIRCFNVFHESLSHRKMANPPSRHGVTISLQ